MACFTPRFLQLFTVLAVVPLTLALPVAVSPKRSVPAAVEVSMFKYTGAVILTLQV
jgi:hypothetical protein